MMHSIKGTVRLFLFFLTLGASLSAVAHASQIEAGDVAKKPADPAVTTDAFDTAAERAQEHVEKARSLFRANRYQDSISELTAAYSLLPRPIYLFNIGQAYRRMGKRREAIAAYEGFAAADPTSSFAAEATNTAREFKAYLRQEELLTYAKRPVWRRGWFWGALVGSSLGVTALTVGLVYGLQPQAASQDHRAPVMVVF